ncbi:MAG: DNRLRE domain-containing protein [Candidatus Lokiarchaeota archaeon]|nr:DNRLRE domain-containing protein [Candidatus Lokiarchaeota archaeon]
MKSKNNATILLLLFFASLGILNTIQPVNAGLVYTTVETFPDRDTYVNSTAPDTNYGNEERFYVGATDESSPFFNAYFHFNFSDQPDTFEKAEVYIPFENVLYPLDLEDVFLVCGLISNDWNETDVTWNNSPSVIKLLTYPYTIKIIQQYEFCVIIDVTAEITGINGVSVLISNTQLNYSLPGYTKESEFPEKGPKLVWTYEPVYPSNPSIVINSNEASTDDDLIDLTLSCNDATEMSFRNETTGSWSVWEPYSTTKQLHLSGTVSNTKYSIHVKFRNNEGESTIIRDSIVYAPITPGGDTIPGFSLLITVSCLVIISLIFYKKKFKS